MEKSSKKPKLVPALRLRCPYCGVTPLRRPGSWFNFAQGCESCDFRFERELGYYAGASWMVNFPVIGVSGFALAGLLLFLMKDSDPMVIAVITSVYMLVFGAWFTPFSMAIWLFVEHRLHPLDADDHFAKTD